jgi:hypothetical protein
MSLIYRIEKLNIIETEETGGHQRMAYRETREMMVKG